jgi:hypothetical protein
MAFSDIAKKGTTPIADQFLGRFPALCASAFKLGGAKGYGPQ